jgi:sulfiredoxin
LQPYWIASAVIDRAIWRNRRRHSIYFEPPDRVESSLGLPAIGSIMLKRDTIPIADIYVPIKRRATIEQKRVDEIAASILDKGLQAPIRVRADGTRFVLVEGLHRLEAAKALGEKTIVAFLVDARKH